MNEYCTMSVQTMKVARFIGGMILAISIVIAPCCADEKSHWRGEAELGGLQTLGNTQTRTLNGTLKVVYILNAWKFSLGGTATSVSDRGVTSSERYKANVEGRYNVNQYLYVLMALEYDKDRFSGYDHRISETLGVGYQFLHNDRLQANMELGLGPRQGRLNSKRKETDTIGRGALHATWQVSPAVAFAEDVESEFGKKGTVYETTTTMSNKLGHTLMIRLGYKTHTNTKPVAGFRRTDSETSVNLVYSFP